MDKEKRKSLNKVLKGALWIGHVPPFFNGGSLKITLIFPSIINHLIKSLLQCCQNIVSKGENKISYEKYSYVRVNNFIIKIKTVKLIQSNIIFITVNAL